tara:strand:+ start:80 stop:265 length:186 start_codon:yes stop_codon:yes gene_type:complete
MVIARLLHIGKMKREIPVERGKEIYRECSVEGVGLMGGISRSVPEMNNHEKLAISNFLKIF